MIRGELERHSRHCARLPVKCVSCGQGVPRNAMCRHLKEACLAVKRKCRFCNQLISRAEMDTHEECCEMRKMACPFCLQFIRNNKMEAHQAGCVRNPNVHRSNTVTNNNSNNIDTAGVAVKSSVSQNNDFIQGNVSSSQQQQQQQPL
uniref:TRAF-type domain-containing protein n=2 Tax=Lygus hesperus TaxID=30085 RepID=A0A0A9WBM8_LYGHE